MNAVSGVNLFNHSILPILSTKTEKYRHREREVSHAQTQTSTYTHRNPRVLSHQCSETELQLAVLYDVYAAIRLSGPEDVFTLLELQKHHVLTELQKQGLLEVTQHPAPERKRDCITHFLYSDNFVNII